MAITAQYRISSNEVIKVSLTGLHPFVTDAYWGVLTAPTLSDGSDCVDVNGDLRVLGVAKFAVVGTNTIRNATAGEITAFATGETANINAMDAAEAINFFQQHPRFRKAFKAMIARIVAENNLQADQWNAFRTQVAAATTLADLKTRVANNTTNMPVRTVAQALTALAADVSAND